MLLVAENFKQILLYIKIYNDKTRVFLGVSIMEKIATAARGLGPKPDHKYFFRKIFQKNIFDLLFL